MDSVIIKDQQRKVVRCGLNQYKTPLFSFDHRGIYVRCKDCRAIDTDGKPRRGAFHLYTWGQVFRMALNVIDEEELFGSVAHEHVDARGSTSSNNNAHEEPTGDSVDSAGGDSGGQLDGVELQVSSI